MSFGSCFTTPADSLLVFEFFTECTPFISWTMINENTYNFYATDLLGGFFLRQRHTNTTGYISQWHRSQLRETQRVVITGAIDLQIPAEMIVDLLASSESVQAHTPRLNNVQN